MKLNPIQTSFSSGELSVRLHGRSDVERYKSAVKTMRNMVPHVQGSTARRGGLRHVADCKLHGSNAALFVFESGGAVYLIECGAGYLRFYLEDTYLAEIAAPWSATEGLDVQYAQTATDMYLVHPNHAPRKLVRTNNTTWVLTAPAFTNNVWAANDYPSAVGYHEQRLWFAGSVSKSQTIWGSKSGQLEDFTKGTLDNDSVEYIIASDVSQTIRWLHVGRKFMAGCDNGIFTIDGLGKPLTPSNVQITRQVGTGAAPVRPLAVANEVIFIQRGNSRLRSTSYKLDSDGYDSLDLSLLAAHLVGGVVDMARTDLPDSAVWLVNADGTLAMTTYLGEGDAFGWALMSTDGSIEAVASVVSGAINQVWCIVRRTINGATRRTLERIDETAWLDSWSVHSGQTITGLARLEGKSVSILADGAALPNQTVTGGQVSLAKAYSVVYVGLAYTSTLETLPYEGGNPVGTARVLPKRYPEVWLRLNASVSPKINGDRAATQQPLTPMSVQQPKVDFVRVHDVGWSRDGLIKIEQDLPVPLHLLAIYSTLQVGSN